LHIYFCFFSFQTAGMKKVYNCAQLEARGACKEQARRRSVSYLFLQHFPGTRNKSNPWLIIMHFAAATTRDAARLFLIHSFSVAIFFPRVFSFFVLYHSTIVPRIVS